MMLWSLESLLEWCGTNRKNFNGQWLPARPVNYRYTFWARVRGAWMVFRGRADAVTWPGGQ